MPERGIPEMFDCPRWEPPIVVPPIVVHEMGVPLMLVPDKPLNVHAMGVVPTTLLPKMVILDKPPNVPGMGVIVITLLSGTVAPVKPLNVVPAIVVAPVSLLPETVIVPAYGVPAKLGDAKPPMDGQEPGVAGASAVVAA